MASAAAILRGRLLGLEHLLDQALAEGGALCGDLVQARLSLGLSAVVGQPVFAGITQALGALAEARGHTVQVHRLLDKTGQALGYDDPGYGDGGKDGFTSATTEIRVDA
ncbi:MAG: hypothetical protein EOP89_05355 [Lysobacteraceae bacterium]|nr:MAG: hypothetical protein EOP89_05355 [Xanthomonadaceae bacterium]